MHAETQPEVLPKPLTAIGDSFEPLVRITVGVLSVELAGRIGHEVTVDRAVILGGLLVQLARFDAGGLASCDGGPYRQVFLPAAAAENQWEEWLIPLPGAKLLTVKGQIAVTRPLKHGEDVTRAGDELMQAERKKWATLRVERPVGEQQEASQVVQAFKGGASARSMKKVSGLGNGLRTAGAHPPPVGLVVLTLEPESRLCPHRHRVPPQRHVLGNTWYPGRDGNREIARVCCHIVGGDPA